MAPLYLMDAVRAGFSPEVVRRASAFLGDPESSVRKSLDTIIPVTLAAVVNRAESAGAESVMALTRDASREDRFGNLAQHFGAGSDGFPAGASSLVQQLFGERYGAVANAVASYTGGRGATISALFGSIVPYVLALLGRHVADNNLSAAEVSSALAGQKASIWAAVPTGLNLASLLAPPSRPSPSYVSASAAPAERRNSWLLPVLLLLIAGSVAWWLMRARTPAPVMIEGLDTAQRPAPAPTSAPVDSADSGRVAGAQLTLPNGEVLDAQRGGFEERLMTFLRDTTAKPDENLWFDFVDLAFEPGTSRIVSGRKELTNLVQILKAYPKVRIKVGGHMDSTANEAASLALSKERAEVVAKELRDAGLAGQVAGVDGHGSAYAKRPASAPEAERARDRRLAISVWAR
jgi:outer membrane protein OmpA-like peptidoglycan-associated protein